MADSRNNETYTGDTLVKVPDVHGNYTVKAGTRHIKSMAFRRREHLTEVILPAGLLSIGDAAFSHCIALAEVTIPSSVETIGAAAFCNSGLETVTFFGVPETIESSAFDNCKNLCKVYIPADTKSIFSKWFDPAILIEIFIAKEKPKPDNPKQEKQKPIQPIPAKQESYENRDLFGNIIEIPQQLNLFAEPVDNRFTERNLFGEVVEKRANLSYNCHKFSWAIGDEVSLSVLFSGPTYLFGNPSYQFRKKCLFIFMKGKLARSLQQIQEYIIPANTTYFKNKYEERYGKRTIPVFIFVCDDGKNARFYDEVRVEKVLDNCLQVKSVLK